MEYCKGNSNNSLELKILVYLSNTWEEKGGESWGKWKCFKPLIVWREDESSGKVEHLAGKVVGGWFSCIRELCEPMRSREGKGNFLAFNKEEEEWVTIQSTLPQKRKQKKESFTAKQVLT